MNRGQLLSNLNHLPNASIEDVNPTNAYSFLMTDENDQIHLVPYNISGIDYYVNNIEGDDANDGLTWETAVAEVNQAITLSEVARLASWGGATLTNHNLKNRIYVQGTGTAYAAVAALPSFCDIIGVGAVSNGNGSGIARIGADGADGIAGTARGLGLYNLQFISGGNYYCADFVNLFRSTIKGCTFQTSTHASTGGLRFSGASGGNVIVDNHWTGNGNVIAAVGFHVQGTNFDSNRIEGNYIHGTTAGVLIDDTCSTGQNGTAADNTVFKNNVIGDLGRGCLTAIDDNCVAGMIQYVGNYVMGTALITCVNNGPARVHGNLSAHGFVTVTES